MIGGISGDKVHAITVRNSDGSLLFEADIKNDDNAETIIRNHPSYMSRYNENYTIDKLNDNTYYINPRIDPSYISDIDRRLNELRNQIG